jgi:transcriptional regulator GlxA family with amidase domain
VARGLERKLVKLLFARFERPRAPEAFSPGRALARRAEAWLRQNLTEPPTIAALCAGVQASERTLHEAFREHLGTTPKAYLKTLRLNAARHDLLHAARGSVTDVALDWGFVHFGWFSQHYRRLFGETPSQTLHRGRAEAVRRGFGSPRQGQRADAGPLAGMYAM